VARAGYGNVPPEADFIADIHNAWPEIKAALDELDRLRAKAGESETQKENEHD